MNVLPIMTPPIPWARKTLQPPVAERHLKAEVAHCVGGVVSPVLANLFMHYAFDGWMQREFPRIPFERYVDDVVVHCATERQARLVQDAITRRLAGLGLEVHPTKTRIVYCKDDDRQGSHEHESFDFLGYTFRPRLAKSRYGKHFVNFSPAVSRPAKQAMGKAIRSWHLPRRSDKTLDDLAAMFNPIIRGWINYYGRFYRSGLYPLLRHINWGPGSLGHAEVQGPARAQAPGATVAGRRRTTPTGPVCALAARAPGRLDNGSPVSREAHAGFCERRGVKLPPPTLLMLGFQHQSDAERFRKTWPIGWPGLA
jgi:Reverse transcriptase (RNA-dependent DNA polymerase)/Group II intron, maturase-specific domain